MGGLTKSTMVAIPTTSMAETTYDYSMFLTPPPSTIDGSLIDGWGRDECASISTKAMRGDSKASEQSFS